jgi:hypothetical protein
VSAWVKTVVSGAWAESAAGPRAAHAAQRRRVLMDVLV